jgi:hypothetical protein
MLMWVPVNMALHVLGLQGGNGFQIWMVAVNILKVMESQQGVVIQLRD